MRANLKLLKMTNTAQKLVLAVVKEYPHFYNMTLPDFKDEKTTVVGTMKQVYN